MQAVATSPHNLGLVPSVSNPAPAFVPVELQPQAVDTYAGSNTYAASKGVAVKGNTGWAGLPAPAGYGAAGGASGKTCSAGRAIGATLLILGGTAATIIGALGFYDRDPIDDLGRRDHDERDAAKYTLVIGGPLLILSGIILAAKSRKSIDD